MLPRGDLYAHLQIHVLSDEWAWGPVRGAGSRWCGREIGLEREDSVGTRRRWVCSIPVEIGGIQIHIETCAAATQPPHFTYRPAYRSAVRIALYL